MDENVKYKNRCLCQRYPFLIPRTDWGDEIIDDYNYEFTNLDDLPSGWRKAFGDQMIEELRNILIEGDYLNEYRVTQIKEKYGALRWYDNGVPESIVDKHDEWLKKYEELSSHTCISCGNPGHLLSTQWISPYCEECFHKCYGSKKYSDYLI